MIGALSRLLLSIIIWIGDIIKSDEMMLYIFKAHPVAPGEFIEIREKLNELSHRAGIKTPDLYITEQPLPGSFIIGKNPDETMLVFPKRLLYIMIIEQIEAMIAYNLVQINDNIRLRTFVALVASLMTMSSSTIRWGAVFTGFGNYNDPAPKLFGRFVMGLVAPPAATMVHSLSKWDYDGRAADLCGSPEALISAIECLGNNNVVGYPSLGFICLIDPQKDSFFEELFDIHLSLKRRIGNLTGKEEA